MAEMKMSNSCWSEPLAKILKPNPAHHQPEIRLAVVGIGNELNGDDAAGVLVVRALRALLSNQPQFLLIEGGVAPEAFSGPLRRFAPDWVLLVDAAEMGEAAGHVAWVDWRLADGLSATTHTLPPTMLAQFLMAELGCQVALIGIQPEGLELDTGLSKAVEAAVHEVALELGRLLGAASEGG
jgi:hydrogenase 3 maturation protease